ncbi:MAG: serine/threonine protein kinase, partial [Myxococcales bacterium]|nr:serine/threonine protein kinase [Myxococcales bacterium]
MSSSLDGERTLGAYQLLSQVAVGGMAEIYVARTHGVGGFEKLVALKVIHPNFSSDPEFVQMLVDEAKLSVQLTHANIVQTFDLGRVDEQYYIAMELIDGVDLYKLLRRASEHQIDFPFEVAAFIAAEVAQGLDYAHRKRDARGRPLKIVHRDVSPQNVLVSYDGEVKIVDFGIAKAAMRGQQTAAGVIKGKYYYMSPEQAWGDPIDARTDIFSAGILLYEMIVGQMLYLEEDLEKLLDVVRKAQIAPPSSHRTGVPRELEAVVMRCLKKRADDRFATAGELAQVLQQFLHSFAPDFSRARLATFVREVMGDDPTSEKRDARSSTTHAPNEAGMVSAIEVRDENSLIFSLSDLRAEPEDAPPPAPPAPLAMAPQPRRADIATNPRAGGGFEENEATIVDAGETPLARRARGVPVGDSERTRPAGPAIRRGTAAMPSGHFDLGAEDPAIDVDLDAPTLS